MSAATSGQPMTTPAHRMTVPDEEAMAELEANDGIAVPILLEEENANSCAAVVLLGLSTSNLMTLASRPELLTVFSDIARGLYRVTKTQGIDLEDVDNRAREIIHEANNPLSTVQNYLKVLSLKLGPDHEAQPTIESISSELMRAAKLFKASVTYRKQPQQAAGPAISTSP